MILTLFDVFHENLLGPDFVDGTSTEIFAEKVVTDYLTRLKATGHILSEINDLSLELKDEVVTMARKKTYGFFSLTEYRKSKIIK